MTGRPEALSLLVGLMLCSRPVALSAATAAVGQSAPEFDVIDALGQQMSIRNLIGQYVVLEWFNPDCPFVRKHYDSGNMQRLQATYTKKGVIWVTIVSSAPGKQGFMTSEQARGVMKQRSAVSTSLILDSKGVIGRLYGAKTTPHMFIVDQTGILVYAGAIDDIPSTNPDDVAGATNYVQRALEELFDGKPVSVAETKPYGCSVKY